MFANKQDIQGSMSSSEIRDVRSSYTTINASQIITIYFQALDLSSIKSHQWKILGCSAVTGQNLTEGLDWVVCDVAGRLYYSSIQDGVASSATITSQA